LAGEREKGERNNLPISAQFLSQQKYPSPQFMMEKVNAAIFFS
jgi:hypothetical protein